jgi:UDP-N-acetylmuramate: L-alanyl-gamma-D-glutamyl-meso-diaminopimelate ligase
MRIHFIAIGGAIMHQLALDLQKNGYIVSGSDDVIQEPSLSRLKEAGLLPSTLGFDASNINDEIDAIVLGMHAKWDNPELTKAMELGLKVYSFPEYVYEQSVDKKRVVIAGSHGKTSITSMIMHTLRFHQIAFDYLVGSNVQGFDHSVKLTKDAPIIVIEGDEYLASCLNKEPKFIYYKANIALLSGIEWDHINVFPTSEIYDQQFVKLMESLSPNATLIYHKEPKIQSLIEPLREDVSKISYDFAPYKINEEHVCIEHEGVTYQFEIFGNHNFQNLEGARKVCHLLGVNDKDFYEAMQQFKGAGRRLEKIVDMEDRIVFKDFAHSPSKLKATVEAVKERYTNRYIVACFELHTFSSLNLDFLSQYKDSIKNVDRVVLFIDEEVVKAKGHASFSKETLAEAFNLNDFDYFTDKKSLIECLNSFQLKKPVYLMMSSGTFGGMDLSQVGECAIEPEQALTIDERLNRINGDELKEQEVISFENLKLTLNVLMLSYILFFIPALYIYLTSKDQWAKRQSAIIFNFNLLSFAFILLGIILMMMNYGMIAFLMTIVALIYHFQSINRSIIRLAREKRLFMLPLVTFLK